MQGKLAASYQLQKHQRTWLLAVLRILLGRMEPLPDLAVGQTCQNATLNDRSTTKDGELKHAHSICDRVEASAAW